MNSSIWINGNVPSSKNSRQITRNGFIIMSKTARKYLKEHEHEWASEENKNLFKSFLVGKEKPYIIGFHFVRGTRHKFDQNNIIQICQDMMVKHGWLDDDNVEEMLPAPLNLNGKYWDFNKLAPGVYIQVL